MKDFKLGGTYRVGIGKGKGDHIKITGVTLLPGEYAKYECETVFGSSNPVKVFFGGSIFAERLEPVEKPKRKIVVTTDGKTTTAKLYDGRETIREAKAVCSDSDTFDFNVGAFLAVERLTGCRLENISLTTGRPMPKTLRDVVAEREPDKIDSDEAGGVKGCPQHYGYLHAKRKTCIECSNCDECWSQPYTPKEETKPEPESLISPETLQRLRDENSAAAIYIKTLTEGFMAKLRETINEKTGGTNHE